jgi:hypothetical protein
VLLHELGFHADEIHRGGMLSDGRIFVPAVAAGQQVNVLVDTAQRIDLSITIGYATKHGWPYERRDATWGISPLVDFAALGRTRPHDRVVVYGPEGEAKIVYSTAGSLGVQYVNHGSIALDPVEAAIGLSERVDLGAAPPAGAQRLALLPDTLDRIPVTCDLIDDNSSGLTPRFIVDTARNDSWLSLEYVERAWSGWWRRRSARRAQARSGKTEVPLRLPNGERVAMEVYVRSALKPSYAGDLGTRIDGYLGLDFLYRWLVVLEFPHSALWLVPLNGMPAIDASVAADTTVRP